MDCKHNDGATWTFCQRCGKVKDRERLRAVGDNILGFVGVQHSMSPKIERWRQTGDPTGV